MKRLAAVAVVALALAGTASADVFRVVPSVSPASPAFLPSAEVPNTPGSISFRPSCSSAGLRRGAQLRPAAGALAARRRPLRRAVAGARGDQQGRVELRPQHGPELGGRDRLDAVHAVDVGALGRRRRRRRAREPVERRGRDRRAARYLAASGGATDISRAVFSYNHAQWYVDEVLQLAAALRQRRGGRDFNLDRLQVSLDQNRKAVVHANRKVLRPSATCAPSAAAQARAAQAGGVTRLLSDRLALDQRAVQLGVRVSAAQARVGSLQAALEPGARRSRPAHDRSLSASFAPAAGSLLGRARLRRPVRLPGRRRPLARLGLAPPPRLPRGRHRRAGGLAGLRARRRDRRALLGYPRRALRDRPDDRHRGRPGGGRTATSRTSTRRVTAGAQLAAGTEVGLVGMTGHATGPAPAPPARPDDLVPAAPALVPELRGRRLPLAGRRPDRLDRQRRPRAGVRRRPHQTEESSGPVVLFTR